MTSTPTLIDLMAGLGPAGAPDRPRLQVLNDAKILRLHEASLEILADIGITVTHPEAMDMLSAAGCRVSGKRIKIPPGLVEEAIATAPKEITIFNREGEPFLQVGSPATYSMTGYTDLDFYDLETGRFRPYRLDDIRLVARVADALPNISAVGHPGAVRPSAENPLEVINHLEVEAMLTNTSKPLHLLVASAEILNDCFEMAEAVAIANGARSLAQKPFVMPMLNPISPLVFGDDTVAKLLLTVDWGLPVICGPMPLAGGTSPATLAGTIAQNNAESLAGLVLAQIRRKGAPYVMITFAEIMDMHTGDVYAGPEATLMQIGAVELGHHYGIPICGSWSGCGYRGRPDAASGWTQMLGILMGMLSGANAGICVGTGTSLEACIMADEIIGMLKRIVEGIAVNEDTLALDVIREVSSRGGSFLEHDHTLDHCREFWEPTLLPRLQGRGSAGSGSQTTGAGVKRKLEAILAREKRRTIPAAALEKIAGIIARARKQVPSRP